MKLEDPVRAVEILAPVVRLEGAAHDLALAGGSVHHGAVADGDAHMALGGGHAEDDHIALADVAHGGDLLIFRDAAPGLARHVALLHAGLVQAPVHKAGAIELAWALRTRAVRAAELAERDLHELVRGSAA